MGRQQPSGERMRGWAQDAPSVLPAQPPAPAVCVGHGCHHPGEAGRALSPHREAGSWSGSHQEWPLHLPLPAGRPCLSQEAVEGHGCRASHVSRVPRRRTGWHGSWRGVGAAGRESASVGLMGSDLDISSPSGQTQGPWGGDWRRRSVMFSCPQRNGNSGMVFQAHWLTHEASQQ